MTRQLALALMLWPVLAAADVDLTLATELRAFTAQSRGDAAASLNLKANHSPRPGERLVLEANARADAREDARSKGDLAEAYYEARTGWLTTRVGARRVFWGVAESRHLVDVINQSDLADDLDGKAKLGQPMLELAASRSGFSAQGYVLTGFRTRRLPGTGGPIRYPFPLALDETRINARAGDLHVDYATRLAWQGEGLDLALSWFDGVSREPRILPCIRRGSGFPGTDTQANCNLGDAAGIAPTSNAFTDLLQALGLAPSDEQVAAEITAQVLQKLVLVPSYERLRQLGLEAQWVRGAFAFKLEALARERLGLTSYAGVLGAEFNLGDVAGSGADFTVVVEGLRDTAPNALEGSSYDHEVFLGGRVSLNNVAGSTLQGGALLDVQGEGQTYVLELGHRLSDAWKLSGKARIFTGGDKQNLANVLTDADELRVVLERFF